MDDGAENVVSLRTKLPTLEARVQRRIAVLQGWLDKGIPHDKVATLPNSLTKAREWHDADLAIYKIGSPRRFTTTDLDYGKDVARIAELLVALNAKIKRTGRSRSTGGASAPTISGREIEQTLSAMVSQWHMAREEARKHKIRADTAEAHLSLTRKESYAKDREIAELRRRISNGLTVVK
jgi:hypothetical protein